MEQPITGLSEAPIHRKIGPLLRVYFASGGTLACGVSARKFRFLNGACAPLPYFGSILELPLFCEQFGNQDSQLLGATAVPRSRERTFYLLGDKNARAVYCGLDLTKHTVGLLWYPSMGFRRVPQAVSLTSTTIGDARSPLASLVRWSNIP